MTCTNPSKPCYVHDPRNEWIVEVGPTTVHAGWLFAILIIAIALSTAWWFTH